MLGVNVYKVGHRSSKSYVDSSFLLQVIDKKGETIVILNTTVHNYTKDMKIMPTTMGSMGVDFYNKETDMEYYTTKIYQLEKRV